MRIVSTEIGPVETIPFHAENAEALKTYCVEWMLLLW